MDRIVVEVPGNPKALPRSRHFRNGVFNPAQPQMQQFKAHVAAALQGGPDNGPMFGRGCAVAVTIEFCMRRPNADFKSNRRANGLKNGLLHLWTNLVSPKRPDIDNMIKFVLDACNGVAHADDAQVCKVVAHKLNDNVGDCSGRTVVSIDLMWESDLPTDIELN